MKNSMHSIPQFPLIKFALIASTGAIELMCAIAISVEIIALHARFTANEITSKITVCNAYILMWDCNSITTATCFTRSLIGGLCYVGLHISADSGKVILGCLRDRCKCKGCLMFTLFSFIIFVWRNKTRDFSVRMSATIGRGATIRMSATIGREVSLKLYIYACVDGRPCCFIRNLK